MSQAAVVAVRTFALVALLAFAALPARAGSVGTTPCDPGFFSASGFQPCDP